MTLRSPILAVAVVGALATLSSAGCAHTALAKPSPFPNAAPSAATEVALHVTVAADVVGAVLALRGTPYRLGGDQPATGFDCSGLVRYVFREVQVDLPRTVAEQFGTGRTVTPAEVMPGDLIFFSTSIPGPSHVGIAVDRHTFVHAPGSGGVVRLERFDTPYWSTRLDGIRRVVEDP